MQPGPPDGVKRESEKGVKREQGTDDTSKPRDAVKRDRGGDVKNEPGDVARKHRADAGYGGRRVIITLFISLGLHVAAVTAVLLLLHAGVPAVVDAPDKPAEVELVMEERKGDLGPTATPSPAQPAPPAPQAEKSPPEQPKPAEAEAQEAAPPIQAAVEAQPEAPEQTKAPARASDPAPATAEPPVQQVKREPPPAPQPAPTISLQGTDSPSDARAWGDRILPAAPDAVFHNRPPEYPREAALNGEHGMVVVLVHISPAGTASGVDVTRSSGYVLLDRAAREAVMRWRFLPAVKDGQPVASDMAMGFVFDYE